MFLSEIKIILGKLGIRGDKYLLITGLGSAALILSLGLLRGFEIRLIGQVALALASAFIPIGWLGAFSIRLMRGVRHLHELRAKLRSLDVLESLSRVDIVCTDKAGSLTENRLVVVAMDVAHQSMNLIEQVHPDGHFKVSFGQPLEVSSTQALLLLGGALCSDAEMIEDIRGEYHATGDLTDAALAVIAARAGFWKRELDDAFPRRLTISFNRKRQRMTTVHELSGYDPKALSGVSMDGVSHIVFTKGAADKLLHLSKYLWVDGQTEPLTDDWRGRIQAAKRNLTNQGMRVVAVGFRRLPALLPPDDLECDLTFVGLFGMVDPPRQSVREVIASCQAMGIRPVIITGDKLSTAQGHARELGLDEFGRALTGRDFAQLSNMNLLSTVEEVQVYVRISREQRLKLVQALQTNGHVVAATSGYDDTLILQSADVGIALGVSSTIAAHTVADLTIMDDRFATLVSALRVARKTMGGLRISTRLALVGVALRAGLVVLAVLLNWSLIPLFWGVLLCNVLVDGLLEMITLHVIGSPLARRRFAIK